MRISPPLASWLADPAARQASMDKIMRFGRDWASDPLFVRLRHSLDAIAEEAPAAIARSIATRFAESAWVEKLIGALVAEMRADPFFDPPFPVVADPMQKGLVLIDHDVATITLSQLSADALRAKRPARGNAGSIGFSGAWTVIRFVRAGGAALMLWEKDGDVCTAGGAGIRPVADGETLVIDGARTAFAVRSAQGDMLLLRARIKPGRAPLVAEHDGESGVLLGLSAADDAASRAQMLLSLLRLCDRADAQPSFLDALDSGQPFVRWHAMREWLMLDAGAALPRLAMLAAADPDPGVRRAARLTLDRIAARSSCRA